MEGNEEEADDKYLKRHLDKELIDIESICEEDDIENDLLDAENIESNNALLKSFGDGENAFDIITK